MELNQLVKAGGKEWKTETMHRVYFNNLAGILGLDCEYYKTGNIRNATLNGEYISNTKARDLISAATGKFFYDMKTQEFGSKYINPKMTQKLIEAVTKKMEGA
ncbi:MAG: hypothetical protein WC481_08875 [Candidatus Omnitrophota bacterium]